MKADYIHKDSLTLGELDGVKVMLSPEAYAEVKRQRIIEENEILLEQQQEIERLNTIINNIANYIDRMSYASIVDNPRQDLVRILDKEK